MTVKGGRSALARLLCALAAAAVLASGAAAQAAPSCSITLSTGPEAFKFCLLVESIGSDFHLLWTPLPAEEDGRHLVKWGLNTTAGGYVAMGFPPNPEPDTGLMIGGTALALQACKSCPTGATLVQWYLGGYSTGEMGVVDSLEVSNVTAESVPGGGMVVTFNQRLPEGLDPAGLQLIFAAGGVYANGAIRKHSTYGITTFSLEDGSTVETETFSMSTSALVAAHLWCMVIGWGVLIPTGIVFARCLKHLDPWWFQFHRALQTLGLTLGLVGFGLGFAIAGGWDGAFPIHRNLAMAATILGVLQLPALMIRPTKYSKYRRAWNFQHWTIGRVATVLAIANVFYGMYEVLDVGKGAQAAYITIFSLIVATALMLEGYAYVQLPPPGATPGLQKPLPSMADITTQMTAQNGNGSATGLVTNGAGTGQNSNGAGTTLMGSGAGSTLMGNGAYSSPGPSSPRPRSSFSA